MAPHLRHEMFGNSQYQSFSQFDPIGGCVCVYVFFFFPKAVWEKLQKNAEAFDFKADQMEEFEDADGNIFNKKTYEDLKRQGLI